MKEFKEFVGKIAQVLRPFRYDFQVVMVLIATVEGLGLIAPYIVGQILNGIQQDILTGDALRLAWLALGVGVAIIVAIHFRTVHQIKHLGVVLDAHLEKITMEKVQELSIGQHLSQHSGITESVINRGRNSVMNLVEVSLFNISPLVARIVVALFALLVFHLYVGVIVLVAVLMVLGLSIYMNEKFYEKIEEQKDRTHRISKYRSEILRNLSLVQVQAQEVRVQKDFSSKLDEYIQKEHGIWVPYMNYAALREFLVELTKWSVLVLGIFLVLEQGYLVGNFVILWAWASYALSGTSSISHYQRQWMRLSSEVRKWLALMDIRPAITVVPNPVRMKSHLGRIEFRSVSFAYRQMKYIDVGGDDVSEAAHLALRGISFIIEPGEHVAFVGESGAGKSTIINLLIRAFDPDEGQVLMDGHDLRLLVPQELREAIGLVEQRVELFDESLRYNVLFGLNGRSQYVSNEELTRIASISRINMFEHRLTNGWDTWIGEKGVKLSGGERQRVGIARALVKNASILILDEATSSLDAKNERFIKDAIREASAGRTTITVAHRLSTVRDADRIFVMDKGLIVAEGRHEELCETSEIYRELVESQLVAV